MCTRLVSRIYNIIFLYVYMYKNYCGDSGPNWYTGPRALFDDMDMSEKKSMIGKAPKGRITQEKGGGIKSKEIIPLG